MTEIKDKYDTTALQHPVQLLDELIHCLQTMQQAGRRGFDCQAEHLQVTDNWGQAPVPNLQHTSGRPLSGRETLTGIRADLGDCRRCKLCSSRKTIVFGQGAETARLVFVGEGPGAQEDQQGLAFVGAAGQLLTKIIQAMKLSREQVYICNIIKCRPPANRNPQPDEINACAPFLKRQLKAIAPEYICALGSFAARTLLETETPVSRLRGRLHDYMGIKLLATYHPAYLLRNPERKRNVWDDMQRLMRALGIEL